MHMNSTGIVNRICFSLFIFISVMGCVTADAKQQAAAKSAQLPLPGSLPLVEYEQQLYRWILERRYSKLGWHRDKGVRDTGGFIDGRYYGTHPAVRIFYSPDVMRWLQAGRPDDQPIADGAIIVKEMFTPPAAIYQELASDARYQDPADYEKLIAGMVNSWTVMVKTARPPVMAGSGAASVYPLKTRRSVNQSSYRLTVRKTVAMNPYAIPALLCPVFVATPRRKRK